jgi:Flp pilus assembly pilin Flp
MQTRLPGHAGRHEDHSGQAAIEYALVIAILSLGMVVVLLGFGDYLVSAAQAGADALIG